MTPRSKKKKTALPKMPPGYRLVRNNMGLYAYVWPNGVVNQTLARSSLEYVAELAWVDYEEMGKKYSQWEPCE